MSGMPLGIQSYIQRAKESFTPITVTLELSLACNLRCHHCYNFDRNKTLKQALPEHREMTTEETFRVIDQIPETGALFVSLTGGEPMSHPDFFRYVERIRKNNLAVKVKTNGTLLSRESVQRLKDLKVFDFDISVYGANPEDHDLFTRKRGSFEKTIEGLKNLKEFGLLANISFILNKINYQDIPNMQKLATALGFRHVFSMQLTQRNDGTDPVEQFGLEAQELEWIYAHDQQGLFTGYRNDSPSVQCACATTNLAIGSNGFVYPCIGAPVKSGDIREKSLKEIWDTSPQFLNIRNLKFKDFKDCHDCTLKPHCQRSSGSAYLNTGNYTGKDPWACEQAAINQKYAEQESL